MIPNRRKRNFKLQDPPIVAVVGPVTAAMVTALGRLASMAAPIVRVWGKGGCFQTAFFCESFRPTGNEKDLWAFLRAADVAFIDGHESEAIETAMGSGMPVVALGYVAAAQIDREFDGLLAKEDDAHTLLYGLLQNINRRTRLGYEARRSYLRRNNPLNRRAPVRRVVK